jgi:hypothetical protein
MPFSSVYLLVLLACALGLFFLPAALVNYRPGRERVSYLFVAAFLATELLGVLFCFLAATVQ